MIGGLHGVAGLGLLAPVVRGVTRRDEVALQVDVDHRVPVLFAQVDEHAVAQDARVVHQHVQGAEGVQRALDETLPALPLRDVVVVGDGLAAHGLDLGDDLFGR